jgi:DNA invertase Pin-like site-specific DNA recombinase
MIRQRIHAGLQRARKAGKVLGRARIEAAIRRSLEKGRGVRETAREMGVGHRTIQRIKGEHQMKEPAGSLGDWHVRSYLNCGCAKTRLATAASGQAATLDY